MARNTIMEYRRGIGPNGMLTKEQVIELPKKIEGKCWIFLGGKSDGYGRKKINGKQYGLHRLVAHIFHGLDLDNKAQLACHINECISTACFNSDHIYVGNRGGNLVDAYIKGTIKSPWIGRTNNTRKKDY